LDFWFLLQEFSMRLTLRTMLAYLDGILEPADRDEIGQKIEESEFARQLVERLRDSTRNPRLSAPKVSGKGIGPDPNTVAEYLDNTLAGERVPDFEKMCLDSDVDLAEVAACHQILTMVLAQPAEIDLEMKQHMYGVVCQASQSPSEAEVGATAREHITALPDELWVKPHRRKVEIPEYLRERSTGPKWKTLVAAAILLFIVAGAIMVALGPMDHTHPVARLLGLGQAVENPPAPAGTAGNQESGTEVHSNSLADGIATAASETPETKNPDSSTNGGPGVSQPGKVAANESNLSDKSAGENSAIDRPINNGIATTQNPPATDTATTLNPSTDHTPPTNVTNVTATDHAPPMDANMPSPLPAPIGSDVAVAPTQPAVSRPSSMDLSRPVPSDVPMPDATTGPRALPAVDTIQPPATSANNNAPLGRVVPSKGTVLLKFDAVSGTWVRVPSGEAVTTNEQLLVLPTYRPTITLSAGLTLQVPAETLLDLKPPDIRGIPTVKLIYGRLVVLTAGKAGAQLSLDLGGINGVVSFVDAEATLGVEVIRHFPAGVNPEIEEPQITAKLYATRGKLEWTPIVGATIALNAMQTLSLNPTGAAANPTATPNMPKWIDPEQLGPLEAQASDFLAQSLQDDKPLPVALREMVDHRKVEFKSMGAQCLALLDEFEPLVAAFSDSYQRPMWKDEIISVKAALARGSGSAAKIHEAFVKQHGEELGKDLYRMFLGYTKDQLQAGEAAKLVDFLDNDSLDCRELAFANLEEITNKTFNYRPEAPTASRAQPLRRWQEELRSGAIVPKEVALQK
jgi:hypothetical protein